MFNANKVIFNKQNKFVLYGSKQMLFGYIPDSHNAEIEESPLIKLENEFIK